MDTSREYIEMCKRAEEIQTDWGYSIRWHNGDFVYCPLNKKTVVLYSNEHHGLPPTKYLYPNSIWIPRQDQLQEMIGDRMGFGEQLKKLRFEYIPNLENRIGKGLTWEQLWLAFVMFEKFNKVWDGKEWIKKD